MASYYRIMAIYLLSICSAIKQMKKKEWNGPAHNQAGGMGRMGRTAARGTGFLARSGRSARGEQVSGITPEGEWAGREGLAALRRRGVLAKCGAAGAC